ncbi:MAG TPA: ABC transporter permease [Thermoanaerobaculia bacterium]|nr:ABC transporter permease [Thermoanaerobaculia bacterium]
MSRLFEDLRFTRRSLVKQPGFTSAAIVTLALAIGANTAIFSVVDSVLLQPSPFRDPDRVMVVWGINADMAKLIGSDDLPQSSANLYEFQRSAGSFAAFALVEQDRLALTGQGEPELLGAVRVTPDFFKVLGASAQVGRTLDAADETPGNALAAVLSYNFWQRRFAGNRNVVGSKVVLNGKPILVAGVMPPRFAFPLTSEMPSYMGFASYPDIWLPRAHTAADKQDRGNRSDLMIGRLKPGVSRQAAQEELNALCRHLGEVHPKTDKDWSLRLVPITAQMTLGLRPILLILWLAVALVLAIACVNVASLQLARSAARQKEIALRTAIGAGRRRLVGQLLFESGLLSLIGGLLGVFLAWGFLRLCATTIPAGLAGAASFSLDLRALLFTLLLCVLTSLLVGLFPAVQMTRPDLAGTLREGTRAGGDTAYGRRTRAGLVVAEVAIAVSVLIGAGLLLRSFLSLMAVDPGFRVANVLTFKLNLPPDRAPEQLSSFYSRLDRNLNSIPGVDSAALVSELPMAGADSITAVDLEGKPKPEPGKLLWVAGRTATPGYFATLGIRLDKGRLLLPGDTRDKAMVAVIDRAMANTYWPGEEVVGKRFKRKDTRDSPWITVVGLVANLRHSGLSSEPHPTLFMTPDQVTRFYMPAQMWGVVHTQGDPRAFSASVRGADYAVDRSQPISDVRPLQDVVNESIAKNRLGLLLLGALAVLALTLTIVGVYGITSYSVTQRTGEIGLRMALGAQRRQVLLRIVWDIGLLAALGIGLGMVLALAVTRVAASYISVVLYKVTVTDPLTFVGVAALLAAVALGAAYFPGRRATQVSPVVALRTE